VNTAVVGGGAWGTALAAHVARVGHSTRIWLREAEAARSINEAHENSIFLPGASLPAALRAETSLATAVTGAELVIVAVPSEFCRQTYRSLGSLLPQGVPFVSATKGIELDSLKRMTEVASEEAPGRTLAVLSGPSFAIEVAREQPTALVVASSDQEVAGVVQRALATRTFRVYSSDDVVGVEIGGALKNVIAIAAGIVDGLGYGHNTVAALITRGLAEMSRLGVALGGRPETFAGLAGLGDLVLTCTGGLSRNRRVGQALGAGETLDEALASLGAAMAEGVRTAVAVCDLADRVGIEMPIAREMKALLREGKSPRTALDDLMLRSLKRE